jgi:hypothetical protein
MKKVMFLVIAMLVFAATFAFAEEIKLTTILPSQSILRANKGSVGGDYNTSGNSQYVSNDNIPDNSLIVEGGVKVGYTDNTNAGTIRWNGTNNTFEGYTGTAWIPLGLQIYDSGWIVPTMGPGYSTILPHNLGAIPRMAFVWFSVNSDGNNARLLGYIAAGGTAPSWQGASIKNCTTTQCTVCIGLNHVFEWDADAGDEKQNANGFIRVILIK